MRLNTRLKWLPFILLAALNLALPAPVFAGAYGRLQVDSTTKDAYGCATAFFTPVASASDLSEIAYGGSRVIKIHRITISYQCSTTTTVNQFFLVKRSTANSAGTAATPAITPLDSGAGAVGAVVKSYTANPTTGTLVGIINTAASSGNGSGTSSANGPDIVLFDENLAGGPIVLRSSGQTVAVNNNGASVSNTSPSLSIKYWWTEE